MKPYDQILRNLPIGHLRIYEALYEAAYGGIACPSNRHLCSVAGYTNPRYASEAVASLEQRGLIAVHRGYKARIVILASGQATYGDLSDLRPMRGQRDHGISGPPLPAIRPLARTSCQYCGVRSDHGCKHQREAA